MDGANEINDQGSTNLESWIVEINKEFSEMESVPQKVPESSKSLVHKKQRSESERSTIHRLPASLREKLPSHYYKPREVQFGPYHSSNQYSRWHRIKKRVLRHFLRRSNKPLDVYVEALREVVQDLREKYDGLGPDHWLQNDNAFIKFMILDGCFLIEIIGELKNYSGWHDINSDHPLWDVDGISQSKLIEDYVHDMLLLENQLPMLLLATLHAIQTEKDIQTARREVNECIYKTICRIRGICRRWNDRRDCEYESTQGLHVLESYRQYLVYQEYRQMEIKNVSLTGYPPFNFNIPSAADIKDVGIEIRSNTGGLKDISFARKMLRLPQIYIDNETRTILINLMAFEELRKFGSREVTSYISLMSGLIKGANDVSILRSCGVIHSSLDNYQVVEMFNSLAKDITHHCLICSPYRNVGAALKSTFDTRYREWKKELWQKYLGSPWAIFSLVFAFLLFALTAVQTVYTVLSYHNSK